MHLVSSHANDVGLTALHLDPLPKGAAREEVAETFYLVDLADSSMAADLKEAGKAVVYQVRPSLMLTRMLMPMPQSGRRFGEQWTPLVPFACGFAGRGCSG